MVKIERILCPTDLSTESDEALRYAVALARAYDAKLLLLHCTDAKSAETPNENRDLTLDIAQSFEEALIPHLGLAQPCELKWEALAIENVRDVGKTITHQAKTHDADLIVMRSRRRPRAAALLGSTAETVSGVLPVLYWLRIRTKLSGSASQPAKSISVAYSSRTTFRLTRIWH